MLDLGSGLHPFHLFSFAPVIFLMNHNLALINSLKARLGLDCMYSVSSSRPTVLICVRVSLALSQSSPVLISNQKYFFLEKIFVRIQMFYCCPHSVLNVSYTSHTRVKLSKKHFSQQKRSCAEQGYLFCFEKCFIPTIKTEYMPPMAKS